MRQDNNSIELNSSFLIVFLVVGIFIYLADFIDFSQFFLPKDEQSTWYQFYWHQEGGHHPEIVQSTILNSNAGKKLVVTKSNSAPVFTIKNDQFIIAQILPEQLKTVLSLQIDLNKATQSLLMVVPGIGKKLAARIVNYREENGDYKSISELTSINGIGPEKVKKFSRYVTVETK